MTMILLASYRWLTTILVVFTGVVDLHSAQENMATGGMMAESMHDEAHAAPEKEGEWLTLPSCLPRVGASTDPERR